MKLSIIIPTFNSSKVIARALDSIVAQTFTDWEVLIMDGVSTDDTLKIAQFYNDSRIRIYSEPDKGIYDAMNKGIKKARGEWLYFLGSDDWLLDGKVFENVFSLDIDNFDVVYGDVESAILGTESQGEWSLSSIDSNRCHQCIFYKRRVFKKLGLYNLEYSVWADHDLNMKWFFSDSIKKKYVPVIIAHYSEGGFSADKRDSQFIKYMPYLKLRRGWNCYSQEERGQLIELALRRFGKKHVGRWLLTMLMKIANSVQR
jgi:glycosyltransferase involved in cell wall biosynthesis